MTEVLRDHFLHFVVMHKLGEQLFVLVHSIDEHLGERAVEFQGEVLAIIDLRGFTQGILIAAPNSSKPSKKW